MTGRYVSGVTVTVGLVQLDCSSSESVASRVARAHALIEEAATTAELVVLPELWHVGAFELDSARDHAERIDGPLATGLGALAKRLNIWLHGGSITEIDSDGTHYNTALLFTPDGRLAVTYRKIHLFGFDGGETALMGRGDSLVVVDTPLGPTGIATCYDLRFPELFRALVAGDAESVIISSGWPARRIAHWDVLTQARAIENQVWVIACNEVGDQSGLILGGHSTVVSPTGEVVARGGDGEEIVYAEVDPSVVSSWRSEFPVLRDIVIS